MSFPSPVTLTVPNTARYVLSPTHLHEYKSADKTQAPVMSLYLPEQKLGSHSSEGSSSNKFILKGRQTGSMHRGHNWVFRAESHDTMMAWYDDIKTLTEQTPEERSNLVRANSRSISRSSQRSSVSSDGVDDDEEPPFTAAVAVAVAPVNQQPRQDGPIRRPSGGRFPSDLQVNAQRGLQVPVSPLSVSSGYGESLNHLDPFTATAPRAIDFEQSPHSFQEVSRARATERGDFHGVTLSDGPAGGPVQPPNSVAAAGAQRQSLQGPRPAGNSTSTWHKTSEIDGDGDGPLWAEPVPIHVPARQQHQQLSPSRDSVGSELYNSQGIPATNGSRNPNKTESRSPQDRESLQGGMMDGMMTAQGDVFSRPDLVVRTDSVPTISHLHIPGEYPRTSSGQ